MNNNVMRRTLTVIIVAQFCLCVFLAAIEFRDFQDAVTMTAVADSAHGYYVCTPAYQSELAAKKKASPNEVVSGHADFQIQMRDCWRVLATRRRNAFFFMLGLSGLSVLELAIHLRKPKGGA